VVVCVVDKVACVVCVFWNVLLQNLNTLTVTVTVTFICLPLSRYSVWS
jgi:hypothetical protein